MTLNNRKPFEAQDYVTHHTKLGDLLPSVASHLRILASELQTGSISRGKFVKQMEFCKNVLIDADRRFLLEERTRPKQPYRGSKAE